MFDTAIVTGFFSIIWTAMGGVLGFCSQLFLEHRDNKKEVKQKALEAYKIVGQLILTFTYHEKKIYKFFESRKQFNINIQEIEYSTSLFHNLEQLELLVVENFNYLSDKFGKFCNMTLDYSIFLCTLDEKIDQPKFNKMKDESWKDRLFLGQELKNYLLKYINKS